MTLEAEFRELRVQLQSNASELASLRTALIEMNAQRPIIVRLDDRRYTAGDVVPAMNNEDRVALDRLLRIVNPEERMIALDGLVSRSVSGHRRETILHNRWILLSGALILLATVGTFALDVWVKTHGN